jgi:hypothetical protein
MAYNEAGVLSMDIAKMFNFTDCYLENGRLIIDKDNFIFGLRDLSEYTSNSTIGPKATYVYVYQPGLKCINMKMVDRSGAGFTAPSIDVMTQNFYADWSKYDDSAYLPNTLKADGTQEVVNYTDVNFASSTTVDFEQYKVFPPSGTNTAVPNGPDGRPMALVPYMRFDVTAEVPSSNFYQGVDFSTYSEKWIDNLTCEVILEYGKETDTEPYIVVPKSLPIVSS